MLGRSAMSSFSDAHELPEIPIIAANLHRLVLPRQSQIWAVLHREDSEARLRYSLAATFLGRMCLSGDYDRLSEAQLAIVQQATSLYRRAAPIIKHGVSRHFGQVGSSWRHPSGWQAVRRISADGQAALVVVHAFESAPSEVKVPLPGKWQIAAQFSDPRLLAGIDDQGESLRLSPLGEFEAAVVLLSRA
jgi:alpha-galactosidase